MTKEELFAGAGVRHVVSVSGGKDSCATYCRALEELGPDGFEAVAADTGNEHPATYEQIGRLHEWTGGPEVRLVKSDFADKILAKRAHVEAHWPRKLTTGVPGKWEWKGNREYRALAFAYLKMKRAGVACEPPHRPEPPPTPADVYGGYPHIVVPGGRWVWVRGRRPMSEAGAADVTQVALEFLQPTGNPFLDLCIWKGRFPSRKAQFCTEELKVAAIDQFVTRPLLAQGLRVVSWQGVRAAESDTRRDLEPIQRLASHDDLPGELWVWRPLLKIKDVDEVFAIAAAHGVPPNPLYGYGLKRVGCFPCINASKAELALVDQVFPEQIDRLEEWERIVSRCSKLGLTTFFNIVNDPAMQEEMNYAEILGEEYEIGLETHGIRRMVQWAKTGRGGRQLDMFGVEPTVCSAWGACE